MKPSPLYSVTVETSAEAEEAAALLLERLCRQPPVTCVNLETGVVTATVFPRKTRPGLRREVAAGLQALRACGLDPAPARIAIRRLRPQNWAESWKRHFKPIEVGSALLIRPSWSRRRPRRGQAEVVLDPGLSFGTGQHPTTAYCLEQIVRHRRPGQDQSLLDVGSGSGILAIAADRLGWRPVVGFDLDAEAVRIARANAALNGVRPRLLAAGVSRFRLPRRRPFHLVCANLTFDLLLAHRRRILGWVRPGGRLVLAGILERQFPQVRAAYTRAGARLEHTGAAGEWRSGTFRRLP